MMSRLYYGAALPDALFSLAKAIINFFMLPPTAYRCLSAIVTALFRQFFTKRKLLEWVPAADSERDFSFGAVLFHNLFSVLCAVFLFVFGSPYSFLCAILFLMNIPFEFYSAKKIRKNESRLDPLTKERMLSHAAAQWKYYEKYCGENDNFLPPDNVQFSPVFRVAHRTSPTNIGLCLVSTLVARDLNFIDSDRLFLRLDRALDSVEKMEKWTTL